MAQTFDLTTGSLAQHFRRLAVPAAIGMVFTTLYNVVDVFFAGLIGTAAQAGLAISFQAFFLFITFGFGLSSAMTALVGNAIGAGTRDRARLVAARGIGFGLIITVMLMGLAWFLGPELIKIVSTDGDYRDAGTRYFIVLILAVPGFIMSFGINGLLQSQGDTVSMQRAQIAAFFANIGLNPLIGFRRSGSMERHRFQRHCRLHGSVTDRRHGLCGLAVDAHGIDGRGDTGLFPAGKRYISGNCQADAAGHDDHVRDDVGGLHRAVLSEEFWHLGRCGLWRGAAGGAAVPASCVRPDRRAAADCGAEFRRWQP